MAIKYQKVGDFWSKLLSFYAEFIAFSHLCWLKNLKVQLFLLCDINLWSLLHNYLMLYRLQICWLDVYTRWKLWGKVMEKVQVSFTLTQMFFYFGSFCRQFISMIKIYMYMYIKSPLQQKHKPPITVLQPKKIRKKRKESLSSQSDITQESTLISHPRAFSWLLKCVSIFGHNFPYY